MRWGEGIDSLEKEREQLLVSYVSLKLGRDSLQSVTNKVHDDNGDDAGNCEQLGGWRRQKR